MLRTIASKHHALEKLALGKASPTIWDLWMIHCPKAINYRPSVAGIILHPVV